MVLLSIIPRTYTYHQNDLRSARAIGETRGAPGYALGHLGPLTTPTPRPSSSSCSLLGQIALLVGLSPYCLSFGLNFAVIFPGCKARVSTCTACVMVGTRQDG